MRQLWKNAVAALTKVAVARKAFVAGLITAALGGAIDQAVSILMTGKIDTHHLKSALIVGAATGVGGYLHPAPGQAKQ